MDYTFKLVHNYVRPVISLTEYHGIHALIDTGARIPVWTISESELMLIGGRKQGQKVRFGGFGGTAYGELFLLDLLLATQGLLLKDLPIVVNGNVNIKCPIILAATCFEGLVYEVNTISRHFRVTSPQSGMLVRSFSYSYLNNGSLDIYSQNITS